jgi:hypothetical protein
MAGSEELWFAANLATAIPEPPSAMDFCGHAGSPLPGLWGWDYFRQSREPSRRPHEAPAGDVAVARCL